MSKKVLIVAPHPDDETLGCGGTLLKHKKQGDEIYWMIVTNIDVENGWDEKKVQERQTEIDQVAQMYGFNKTFKLDYPTTKMDSVPNNELIDKISDIIKEVEPSIIYLPYCKDIHTDHQVIFNAALSCTKNFRYPFINRIVMYETLSETEFGPAIEECAFTPNMFVDISEHFEKKIDIFKLFASEVMEAPKPRSIQAIKGLAQYRGSRIGKEYAEAFCLLFAKDE